MPSDIPAGAHVSAASADRTTFARALSRRLQASWKPIVIAVPFCFLLMFFLFPFFIVGKISLSESVIAVPPFAPMIEWVDEGVISVTIVLENFSYLFENDLYTDTYMNSVKISTISTIICLLIGYPIAYAIVHAAPTMKHLLLFLIILPFWTSSLLRVYAWMGLLADRGTINGILIDLGIVETPIRMLYTEFAVYVGIVYTYLPFMVLPLYANLEKLDTGLNEASADLGAKPVGTLFSITLPLSRPGIVAGSLLVFIPATGEFIIPDLLGGGNVLMIGRLLYQEFFANTDWPTASAVAIVLLVLLVAPMMIYQHYQARETEGR